MPKLTPPVSDSPYVVYWLEGMGDILLKATQVHGKQVRTEDSFAIGVKTRFLTLLICNWFHLQLVSFAIGVETHGIVLWLHFFWPTFWLHCILYRTYMGGEAPPISKIQNTM